VHRASGGSAGRVADGAARQLDQLGQPVRDPAVSHNASDRQHNGAITRVGDITLKGVNAGNTAFDANLILGTTTGTKIGTATTQKLAFYNATPIVQPTATAAATDAATTQTLANGIRTALINLGLWA
jgi:hypothetical protein